MNRFVFRRFDWSFNEPASHAANEQWFSRNVSQWAKFWEEKNWCYQLMKSLFWLKESSPMLKNEKKNMMIHSKLFRYEVMNYMIFEKKPFSCVKNALLLREKCLSVGESPNSYGENWREKPKKKKKLKRNERNFQCIEFFSN